jgi:hypothetical protein
MILCFKKELASSLLQLKLKVEASISDWVYTKKPYFRCTPSEMDVFSLLYQFLVSIFGWS